MAENPPANAGDTSLIPGPVGFHMRQGNHTHVPQLLKPKHPRARALQQEKPPQSEAHALPRESSPHLLQLEKACAQQWRPSKAKENKQFFKIKR